MKKITFLFIAFLLINSCSLFAQDEEMLNRPNNIGNADIDTWVNSCFDLYIESFETDTAIIEVDNKLGEITEDVLSASKTDKENLNISINDLNKGVKEMSGQMASLAGKSEDMTVNAKNISPKTKVPKAIKNVKAGMNALNATKSKIPEQSKKIAEQSAKAKEIL